MNPPPPPPSPSLHRVEWELWLTAQDACGRACNSTRAFLQTFTETAKSLEQVSCQLSKFHFIEHYVVRCAVALGVSRRPVPCLRCPRHSPPTPNHPSLLEGFIKVKTDKLYCFFPTGAIHPVHTARDDTGLLPLADPRRVPGRLHPPRAVLRSDGGTSRALGAVYRGAGASAGRRPLQTVVGG